MKDRYSDFAWWEQDKNGYTRLAVECPFAKSSLIEVLLAANQKPMPDLGVEFKLLKGQESKDVKNRAPITIKSDARNSLNGLAAICDGVFRGLSPMDLLGDYWWIKAEGEGDGDSFEPLVHLNHRDRLNCVLWKIISNASPGGGLTIGKLADTQTLNVYSAKTECPKEILVFRK